MATLAALVRHDDGRLELMTTLAALVCCDAEKYLSPFCNGTTIFIKNFKNQYLSVEIQKILL
jgi:hypothetical protein